MKNYHDARDDGEPDTESLLSSKSASSDKERKGSSGALVGTESGPDAGASGFPPSIKYIVGNEFCERFCYYGMRAVLILYMTCPMALSESTAIMINHGFIAMCYLTPLMGGALSDGYLGKYNTIFYLSIVYACGSTVLAYSSSDATPRDAIKLPGLLIGLLLIAVGTGGIKPCVSSFGGDQFRGANKAVQIQTFFAVFYFAINAGSVLSILITPLLRDYGCPSCGGADCSFALAFGLPALLMIVSIAILTLGRRRVGYHEVPPSHEPVFSRLFKVRFAEGTPPTAAPSDRKEASVRRARSHSHSRRAYDEVPDTPPPQVKLGAMTLRRAAAWGRRMAWVRRWWRATGGTRRPAGSMGGRRRRRCGRC